MSNIHEVLNAVADRAETVWVMTYSTEKSKRTITGKYTTHDLTEVILLDEKGRFRKAPIDKITRINYYHPDRAPF
jgi:hypothetical protein